MIAADGSGGSADAVSPLLAQSIMHLLEHTVRGPTAEGLVRSRPRRKRLGQQTPRTACAKHIAAGIHQMPALVASGRAWSTGSLEQIRYQRPFGIRQVGVHAAGAVAAAMGWLVAVALGLGGSDGTALNCRASNRPTQGLDPHNATHAKQLADGLLAELQSRASKELSGEFVHRCMRLLACNRAEGLRVLGVHDRWDAPGVLISQPALASPWGPLASEQGTRLPQID